MTGKDQLQTVPVGPVTLSPEGPDSFLARIERQHSDTAACRGIVAPTPVSTAVPEMPVMPVTLPLYRTYRVPSRIERPQSDTAACRGVVAPTPGEPVDPPGVTHVALDCVRGDYCTTPVCFQHESGQRHGRARHPKAPLVCRQRRHWSHTLVNLQLHRRDESYVVPPQKGVVTGGPQRLPRKWKNVDSVSRPWHPRKPVRRLCHWPAGGTARATHARAERVGRS